MFAEGTSKWTVRTHGDRMFRPTTLAAAAASMSAAADEYFNRGSGDEVALNDNITAWRSWAISPRVLVGVETVDLSVEVLGERWRHPLAIAPMARHNLATPDAERATVAAAAATETPCCISVGSSCDPRELATAAAGNPLWFQMCLFKDQQVTKELATMATDAGYRCLVITVDNPSVGLRNHFSVEVGRPDAAVSPARPMPKLELSPAATWADLERFISAQSIPVAVKGILSAEDARHAAAVGASAVIVSNHGGRQLDRAPATADVLPDIASAVGDEVQVLVDGGIRSGADAVVALALGARAVLIGRPVLWGLSSAGQHGAEVTILALLEEMASTMALAGMRSVAEVSRDRMISVPRRAAVR